jgi:predicted permease
MRALRAWAIRVAGLVTGRRRVREFEAEMQSHLAMETDEQIRRGAAPEEARRRALAAAGGVQAAREAYRDRVGLPLVDALGQDLRFALRVLRKSPGFTATAVVVLAIGIGANGALFSLINGLLLRPVVPGAGEIVGLYSGSRERPDAFRAFSYPEYVDIRDRNDVFTNLVAETAARVGVSENGATTRAVAMVVSSNYFTAFGVSMAVGRTFTRAEERPGSGASAVIVSYAYWRRHARDPRILGGTLLVNDRPLTVVGVAPETFHGTMPVMSTDLWLPMGAADVIGGDGGAFATGVSNDRTLRTLLLLGRLKDGVSIDEANARLTPLASALSAAFPEPNRSQRLVVHTRSRVARGARPRTDTEPMLGATVLMVVAGLVLLVACLNVANMLMARGSARRQEIAVRIALGGGRGRLLRQLLVEGLLLSFTAGIAALAVGWWAANRLVGTLIAIAPATVSIDVSPDVRVVAAIVVACVASTLMFALGPAWKLSKPDLVPSLKQDVPIGDARAGRMRMPHVLVGVQVGLSLALLIAAGAFVQAGASAARGNAGFPLAGGLVVETDARLSRLDEAEGRAAYAAVLDRLRQLPGVRAASAASIVPLGPSRDEREIRSPASTAVTSATYTVIGTDYFDALGLSLWRGREFTLEEERGSSTDPVVLVDRLLADELFPAGDALGQIVELLVFGDSPPTPARIVGIVPSVRDDLLDPPAAHVYVPFGQQYRAEMTLHVRTDPGAEHAMLAAVRTALTGGGTRLPILSAATLTELRDRAITLWAVLFAARGFAAFGLIALFVTTVGVYGLRAYLVGLRTREIGIRLALGATRERITGQLVREGATVATVGIVGGLGLAVAIVQVLRQTSMLVEVQLLNPAVVAATVSLLGAAVFAASYVPARRAARIDPAVALRPE